MKAKLQNKRIHLIILIMILAMISNTVRAESLTLLNASYDPTREFYEEYNQLFAKYWKDKSGQDVQFQQSHGGSAKQARAVIDGLPADVVTLALAYDIDAIAKNGKLLPTDWQTRLPHNSSPYTSTMIFLVRKDNPKQIKDWDDLVKPGTAVITPNPKTSGAARWNYLAAWSYAAKKWVDETKTKEFVKTLYKNVVVLDSGARGATTTFAQRGIGDVLITWENEAQLALKEFGSDKFEIVVPTLSILAEPAVAIIDKNVDKHGTRELANAYLEYLYSPDAQRLAVKHHYRPTVEPVVQESVSQFPKLEFVTLKQMFGSWDDVQKIHFADGGVFDQIYAQ